MAWPVDRQRKDIAKGIEALETDITALEEKKWERLDLSQEPQDASPDDSASPEKQGKPKKSHRGGDIEAATELLLILRMLWQVLHQQCQP